MPSYKVKARGFMFGRLYEPDGKRQVLHSDKALKPIPKWLEPIKETAETARKRTAKQKKQDEAAAKKAKEDKIEKDAVTFTEGPATSQPGVENL